MGDKYESLELCFLYHCPMIIELLDGAEGARFCVHLKESLGKDFAYKLAV